MQILLQIGEAIRLTEKIDDFTPLQWITTILLMVLMAVIGYTVHLLSKESKKRDLWNEEKEKQITLLETRLSNYQTEHQILSTKVELISKQNDNLRKDQDDFRKEQTEMYREITKMNMELSKTITQIAKDLEFVKGKLSDR